MKPFDREKFTLSKKKNISLGMIELRNPLVVFLSMANVSYTEVGNPMLAHLKLLLMYAPRNLLSRHSPEVSSRSKIEWAVGQRVVG